MNNFPAMCIDNFYDNPDEIRNFALSLQFEKHNGNYPGIRSEEIYTLDRNLYNKFCEKLLSIFYNFNNEYIEWNISTKFQKIYPYSKDKNSLLNSGWYHKDSDRSIAAGVIYLNPDSNLDSGTIIGRLKNSEPMFPEYHWRDSFYRSKLPEIEFNTDKDIFPKCENAPDLNIYQHELLIHNSKIEKTLEFKNVYNRLIIYDGENVHRESNFFANEYEPRLTQVFFINAIPNNKKPIERMRGIQI